VEVAEWTTMAAVSPSTRGRSRVELGGHPAPAPGGVGSWTENVCRLLADSGRVGRPQEREEEK
jgi:hypothetical protein